MYQSQFPLPSLLPLLQLKNLKETQFNKNLWSMRLNFKYNLIILLAKIKCKGNKES